MSKFTCKRAKEIYDTLKKCSSDLFLNSWRNWFDEIIAAFDSPAGGPVNPSKKASCLLLDEFLYVAVQFPTVSKDFASEKMQILISKLIENGHSSDDHVLLALKSCLKYFPGPCGRSATKYIIPFLCKLVDSNLHTIRRSAADCFSFLPIIGPGGEKRLKHAENYSKQINFLLFTAHECLHLLFGVERNGQESDSCKFSLKTDEIQVVVLNELTSLDVETLVNRMDFCLACLKFMLIRSTDFQVEIPLMTFMQFLRCITQTVTSKNIRCDLISRLTDSCESFLTTFSILPSIVHYSLAPYCAEIYDLFETILHKTSKSIELQSIRIGVYSNFEHIASNLGATSKLQSHLPKVWRYCKADLQAKLLLAKVFPIETGSNFDEKTKLKRKKSSNKGKTAIDVVDQFVVKNADASLARKFIVSSAKMLTKVVQRVGPALKAGLYRDLQQFLCKLIMNFQIETCSKLPFDNAECRLNVYHLLKSLVLCQHAGCPSALQCALSIFHEGVKDNDVDVSNFCYESLLMMNNLTKPRIPCLESMIPSNELMKPVEFDEMSEENYIDEQENVMNSVANGLGHQKGPIGPEDRNGIRGPECQTNAKVNEGVDDDDDGRIIVNIDSESDEDDDENCEEIQIVTPSKKVKFDSIAPKFDDEVKILDNHREDISQMLLDFVDEPVDA